MAMFDRPAGAHAFFASWQLEYTKIYPPVHGSQPRDSGLRKTPHQPARGIRPQN